MSTTVIVLIIAAVAVIALVIATRKPALPSAGDAALDGLPPGTPKGAKDETKAPPTDAPPADAAPSDEAAAAEGQRDTAITVMPDESDPESAPRPGPPSRTPGKRNEDIVRLRKGLSKVRASEGLFGRLKTLLGGKKEIAPDLVEEIEEILLTSDVGVKTTEMLLSDLRDRLEKKELGDPDKV
ncbi:MAG: signal recognition particle receptor subunit alpha, partial [Polyangiaceae bacterium]